MGQRMPEPNFDPFQNFNDRRVIASVLWRRGEIVGIIVVRRRDGWSAILALPDEAHRRLACGVSRRTVLRFWEKLRIAVQWGLHELQFEECREFCIGDQGGEPALCGNLRGFGGEFIAVDIGEFESPDLRRLN